MLRAGKGTIQRQAELNSYSKKIDGFHIEVDSGDSSSWPHDLASQNFVAQIDRKPVKDVTRQNHPDNWHYFFSPRMNSLQVLPLRRELTVTSRLRACSIKQLRVGIVTVAACTSLQLLFTL
ncbi:hypothetical protein AOQ84DRAFT_383346 [Glonium stellatum]|uniref:Uncharacterized protein n=1 Tax=Glonium stellatum TaxID=574774 RepID=A0A8E2ENK5_9PEZI|nr:hypothetical protein AOQ84DRAFT_383346 [Glonium stellatum]